MRYFLFVFLSLFLLSGCGSSEKEQSVWNSVDGDYSPKIIVKYGENHDDADSLFVVNVADDISDRKQIASVKDWQIIELFSTTGRAVAAVYTDYESNQLYFLDVSSGIGEPKPLITFPEGGVVCDLKVLSADNLEDSVVWYRLRDENQDCVDVNYFVTIGDWSNESSPLPVLAGEVSPLVNESDSFSGFMLLQLDEGELNVWDDSLSRRTSLIEENAEFAREIGAFSTQVVLNVSYAGAQELRILSLDTLSLSPPLAEGEFSEAIYVSDQNSWIVASPDGLSLVTDDGAPPSLFYEFYSLNMSNLRVVNDRLLFNYIYSAPGGHLGSVMLDGSDHWDLSPGYIAWSGQDSFIVSLFSWWGAAASHELVKYTVSSQVELRHQGFRHLNTLGEDQLLVLQQDPHVLQESYCSLEQGVLKLIDPGFSTIETYGELLSPFDDYFIKVASGVIGSDGLLSGELTLEPQSDGCRYGGIGESNLDVFFYYHEPSKSIVYVPI